MKGLAKTKEGFGLELIDLEEPSIDEVYNVKVKVKFTGICGTDLHIYHDDFYVPKPLVIGHEFSGIVAEVGDNVKDLKVGDRVTVLPSNYHTCQECYYCKNGYYVFCDERRGLGLHINGGFSKYSVIREDMVYKIPDHISLEEAAMSEPFAVASQGVHELADIKPSDTVLVSGPGPIGLLAISALVERECNVVVTGTTADHVRLDIAKKLGVDRVIDVGKENLQDIIDHLTGGAGVDYVVECSGNQHAISSAIQAVKKLGTIIQLGIIGNEIEIDYDLFLYKQIKLQGSMGHRPKTWDKVIEFFETSEKSLKEIITHKFPLSEWEQAFELGDSKACGKILLYYDE